MDILAAIKREERKLEKQLGKLQRPVRRWESEDQKSREETMGRVKAQAKKQWDKI
jgi:hypothetical protein